MSNKKKKKLAVLGSRLISLDEPGKTGPRGLPLAVIPGTEESFKEAKELAKRTKARLAAKRKRIASTGRKRRA